MTVIMRRIHVLWLCWVLQVWLSCFNILSRVDGQLIIPQRPLGFVYRNGRWTAPIHFDVHMDPLCSDSKACFPTIQEVADHYGPEVLKLTLHQFPLPYHKCAYDAINAAHIIEALYGSTVTWNWFKLLYDNLDTFSNDNTAHLSSDDVRVLFSMYAEDIGVSRWDFLNQFEHNITHYKTLTRTAFKYTCTRSIANTPTFLLNDIQVTAAESRWTVSQWINLIDGLLRRNT